MNFLKRLFCDHFYTEDSPDTLMEIELFKASGGTARVWWCKACGKRTVMPYGWFPLNPR